MTLLVKVVYGLVNDVEAFEKAFTEAIDWISTQHKRYSWKTEYQATDDRMYCFIEYAPLSDPPPQKPPEDY